MTASPGDPSAVDRRRFLKRAGTIAWSTPLVWTVIQESALAQPCGGNNAACGNLVGGVCVTTGFNPCCTGFSCTVVGQSCKCK